MSKFINERQLEEVVPFFLCHVASSDSSFKSIFVAKDPSKTVSVMAVNSPLKANTIEKYFLKECDLQTIKGSLLEAPHIFKFDQACHNDA